MQNLALLLLLAAMASMVFVFDVPVFAQDAPSEDMTEDETTEEETSEETTDEMTEDDAMEDEMEDAMEQVEAVVSPLKQMLTVTDPHEIQCKPGQTLVFKASNWRPACINESSFDILASRGWVASHDPSHEDLMKMQDDYMTAHPQEVEEEQMEEQVEDEMTEETEDESIEESIETEPEGETQPQNHTVNLSEKVSVSAL